MPFYGTGTVLFEDTFTYSNGDLATVGTAKWAAGFWTGQPTLRVVSNKAQGRASAAWGDNYSKTTVSVGSSGLEVIWNNITPASATTWTYCHILGAHGASPNGYYLRFRNGGSQKYEVGKLVSGAFNSLIVSTVAPVAGDSVALQILPSGVITMWRKPSGGSWSQIGSSATDTTYTSGVVALETYTVAVCWDSVEVRQIPSRLKRWNGSSWVVAKLKAGASWTEKPVKKL